MKIIITSIAVLGASSVMVNTQQTEGKLTIPMIFKNEQPIEIEHSAIQNNFILVPHAECNIDKNNNLEKSIRECVKINKTWLKAI
tara:strand:+ start:4122 stop:4376 length:255 start_codon:yes stop_codon:yes gene_type:complete